MNLFNNQHEKGNKFEKNSNIVTINVKNMINYLKYDF